jgi:hypothetical protein
MQRFVYDIIISKNFHVAISIVVVLNIISLAFEYYNQSTHYNVILNILNSTFATIFGLEIIFKLIGFRQHFFLDMWNVYDLLVTTIFILSTFLKFKY